MNKFLLGLALSVCLTTGAAAQSTAANSSIGYLTTSACPNGLTVCFKQYGATVPVSGTITPSGTQDTNVKQINGVTVSVGSGASGTGTQRVITSTDSTLSSVGSITSALPAGTNVIGHVITDTGSTTAVTGTVTSTGSVYGPTAIGSAAANPPVYMGGTIGGGATNNVIGLNLTSNGQVLVAQGTASSLNATVVGTGTLAVQNTAATPAGSNVIGHVIADTGSTTAVTGTVASTQSGTWNVTNVSGTVSLPTGAATSASQTNVQSAAGTPNSTAITIQGNASGVAVPVSGTITITPSGTQDENLKQVNGATVNVGAGAAGTGTQRVTTSTDSTIGTVTSVTAIANALPAGSNVIGHVINDASSAVIGHVIADTGSTTAVTGTVTVSGTVTANAGTNLNTSLLALESGGNLATLAGGVTSSVFQENVKQVNGVTVLAGTGATGTGSQRVTVAVDSATVAGSATLPAGSNIIGKVGIDQTTPGTTNAVSTTNFPSTVSTGTGAQGASSPRVTVATDTATIAGSAPGTTASPSTNAVSTVSLASAASTAGVAPVNSSSVETGHVIKASAGNLYDFNVSADSTLSAVAWAVMIFNSTTVPASGAVTPVKCYLAPIGTTSISGAFPTPLYLGTGISIAVSTGQTCFTKTDSAHGFISASAQ